MVTSLPPKKEHIFCFLSPLVLIHLDPTHSVHDSIVTGSSFNFYLADSEHNNLQVLSYTIRTPTKLPIDFFSILCLGFWNSLLSKLSTNFVVEFWAKTFGSKFSWELGIFLVSTSFQPENLWIGLRAAFRVTHSLTRQLYNSNDICHRLEPAAPITNAMHSTCSEYSYNPMNLIIGGPLIASGMPRGLKLIPPFINWLPFENFFPEDWAFSSKTL